MNNRLGKWLAAWPRRLSRITTSGRYIAEVDGLRFMAILPVLVQHLSERVERYSPVEWSVPVTQNDVAFWSSRGTIGVFIFFAISGFILGLPFAKHHLQGSKKVAYRDYLWRRITRLEPPYIVWMVVCFLVLLVKGGMSFSELFPHLGASLIYGHNLIYGDYSIINPVAWSLEIEIQFYLLAPVLAWLFFRWKNTWLRRGLLAASIVVTVVAQVQLGWVALPYKLTLLWQLHYFLVGFLVADFFLVDWKGANKNQGHWAWDLLAIGTFIIMCLTWAADLDKRLIFAAALLIFLVAGFRGRWFTAFLRRPWIATIGGMCYTIYLIHLPLLEGLTRLTTKVQLGTDFGWNLLLQAMLTFPIILFVSAVGFLLLEKPCMDKHWPQKLRDWFKTVLGRPPIFDHPKR